MITQVFITVLANMLYHKKVYLKSTCYFYLLLLSIYFNLSLVLIQFSVIVNHDCLTSAIVLFYNLSPDS